MMKRVLIRADANQRVGSGHLMRCVAVAQELVRQKIPVRLLTAAEAPALKAYLAQ